MQSDENFDHFEFFLAWTFGMRENRCAKEDRKYNYRFDARNKAKCSLSEIEVFLFEVGENTGEKYELNGGTTAKKNNDRGVGMRWVQSFCSTMDGIVCRKRRGTEHCGTKRYSFRKVCLCFQL